MRPLTLLSIHAASGVYVVGLKANQAQLYRHCICRCLFNSADYEQVDVVTNHHGRLEQRTYRCFLLNPLALAPRRQEAGVATLIWVKLHRRQAGAVSNVESYFVSNSCPANKSEAQELFKAIRQHWGVNRAAGAVMHHKREVALAEDDLQTGNAVVSRILGNLRTLVVNLSERLKVKNMVVQLETFADTFYTLIQFLTQQSVL